MCGICGYISEKSIEDRVLCEMRDTMIHRGPNDGGHVQKKTSKGYIGLAQRRLSIFDLSELGHQPMISPDGHFYIVYNGEVYNFKSIREELRQKGYTFKSECDTEVILASYIEWGEQCFARFNGMFAIAIWDDNDQKLILARDRMGVKPLYYYWNRQNNDFVFGSELKPIMKYPDFSRNIRMDMLGNYLCNKYIAAPNTIFENTYKLLPGTYLVYNLQEVNQKYYWDILAKKDEAKQEKKTSFIECKNNLNDLLLDAVATRLEADVPVGAFLSGGIDSALITSLAQKVSDRPVKTFTIGFYENERNEANEAKAIAEYLGTEHTELYVGEKEILNMIDEISFFYDEPFSDSSQLPTMLVSKLAADNVTVALSGDGGDELFCGYKMYDWTYIAQKADWIGSILYHIPGMDILKDKMPPELRAFINNRDKGLKTQLFIDVMTEQARELLINSNGINPKFDYERRMDYSNWQERRMILDMMTYLPDEIMAKTDRASMKYSLEVRSPLLDYRVVEESFRISHGFKYTKFDKKHILKELAYDYIPKELLDGPKRGFGVPLAKWIRGPLKQEILKYSDSTYIKRQGIFDVESLSSLIDMQEKSNKIMYSSMLWSFYIFQRWWEKYIE